MERRAERKTSPIDARTRLNLFIPSGLGADLDKLASELQLQKADLARHLMKIGIEALRASRDPNRGLWFGKEDGDRDKIIFPL